MARRVMNMCTINVFSVEDNMLTTHFDMMPDEPTDATRALLERATDARLTVQEVRVVSDDMGARIVIADDRDRHVLYDMHVQRIVPTWDYTAARGAQVVAIRVHLSNDWDHVIDVFDRCATFDARSWEHALINGRLYRRVCSSRRLGGARIYDSGDTGGTR
jgi:hypothetical protein